jgi:outer membrane lipoprotein
MPRPSTPFRGRPGPPAIAWGARVTGLVAGLVLTACATGVPESIRDPQVTPIDVKDAQTAPDRHLGQRVRWGGTVIGVTNGERSTEIEILARPLGRDGAPDSSSPGQGRFIAEAAGFLDPAEYPKGRELTVVGILTGTVTRSVGDFPYVYPVVRTESRYLWPEAPTAVPYGPPYPWPWYDPWYGPWYAPYYRPYYAVPRRHWH